MDLTNDPVAQKVEPIMAKIRNQMVGIHLSGANYNRIYEAFYNLLSQPKELPKQLEEVNEDAIGFAEWIKENYDMSDSGEWCTYVYKNRCNPEEIIHTTKELYNLYLISKVN